MSVAQSKEAASVSVALEATTFSSCVCITPGIAQNLHTIQCEHLQITIAQFIVLEMLLLFCKKLSQSKCPIPPPPPFLN